MKVFGLTGVPEVKGIRFGIECETEGARLPQEIPGGVWRTERDGSLRGEAFEYVFTRPLTMEASLKALSVLNKQFVECQSILDYSFRTSTHVHLNVSDLELKKALQIVFLYFILEDLFMGFCAKSRHGNRFCLRFKDADALVDVLSNIIRDSHREFALDTIDQERAKYAALNLYTLKKYGTLEFRSLEGTNDQEKIKAWLIAITNLYAVATRYGSLNELCEAFFNDPSTLVEEVFGNTGMRERFLFGNWQRNVEESYSLAHALVFQERN